MHTFGETSLSNPIALLCKRIMQDTANPCWKRPAFTEMSNPQQWTIKIYWIYFWPSESKQSSAGLNSVKPKVAKSGFEALNLLQRLYAASSIYDSSTCLTLLYLHVLSQVSSSRKQQVTLASSKCLWPGTVGATVDNWIELILVLSW